MTETFDEYCLRRHLIARLRGLEDHRRRLLEWVLEDARGMAGAVSVERAVSDVFDRYIGADPDDRDDH